MLPPLIQRNIEPGSNCSDQWAAYNGIRNIVIPLFQYFTMLCTTTPKHCESEHWIYITNHVKCMLRNCKRKHEAIMECTAQCSHATLMRLCRDSGIEKHICKCAQHFK